MRLVSFFPHASSSLPTSARSPRSEAVARRAGRAGWFAFFVLLGSSIAAAGGAARAAGPDDTARATATYEDLVRALAEADSPEVAVRIRRDLERRRAHSGSAAADLLAARAVAARTAGDAGTALDLLDATIAIAPDWAMAWRMRGLVHLERAAHGRAARDLGEAIRRDPTDVPSLLAEAALQELRGDKARALDLLRRATALDPRATGLVEAIDRLAPAVEGRPL